MEGGETAKKRKDYGFPQELVMENVSPATHLLEKRRQMLEVQEALDAQKDEFAEKEEGFKRREEALKKRDIELQESLIKFNKFLQENEAKRTRAEKKGLDEKKQTQSKEGEIRALKEEIRQMEVQQRKDREVLENYTRYKTFLESVVERSDRDHFDAVDEVIGRYETLMHTRKELLETQAEHQHQIEEVSREMKEYRTRKQNELLVMNSSIAQKKFQEENVIQQLLNLQSQFEQKAMDAETKSLDLGKIKLACDNIFERLVKYFDPRGVDMDRRKDTKYQLNFIGQYMEDLTAILKTKKAGGDPTAAAKTQA